MCALIGDWTWNLGMFPDQESNPQPFGYGMMLQPTEPPGQGWTTDFFIGCYSQLLFKPEQLFLKGL